MSSFNDCRDIILDNFTNPATRERAIMMQGEPGCAKTSMGKAVASLVDVPPERVRVITPARSNPVNFMGMPASNDEHMMVWNEPEEMHELSQGEWVLIIDEVGQCGPMMQSTMGGLMLDRCINKVPLSPDVCVLATTNRVEDKAGSKPIMTHTANRLMILDMEYSHTDFIPWGIDEGLDPIGLAFIQFAPQHLKDFDPDRTINATPRSWEYALKINPNLRKDLYLTAMSGVIPSGIAAEYIGFREIVSRLPNPEEVRRSPTTAAIPVEVDVLYALIANLLVNTQEVKEFDHIMAYVTRLPVEFQTLYVHTCVKRVELANQSPVYVKWIHDNVGVLGGTS